MNILEAFILGVGWGIGAAAGFFIAAVLLVALLFKVLS